MSGLPAYILAGGRSSRFGSDKARAVYQGEALIVRQARQLQALGHPITIVAREAGQYEDLGLATIGDLEPDHGPAAGASTALRHRGAGWLILTSCDLVVLKAAWIERLIGAIDDEVSAAAFRSDRWQPFPGLYHTRLLTHPEAWRKQSLQHLLATAPARALPIPADWPAIVQVNTPADLLRAQG